MSNKWPFIKIKNYPFLIIDGDRGTNYPAKEDFLDTGFCVFLNTGNVTSSGFDFKSCNFITEKKHKELRKGLLERNDIVLTTRGTIGNVAFYSDSVDYSCLRINSGMVILRPDPNKLIPSFLYQLMKSVVFQEQALAFRYGAAQPQLPIATLKHIQLPLPDKDVQKKIAAILSAYDDLIENNLKRIKLLEEMAQITYEEWFVRLKFPGHETTPLDSATGLPVGWEKRKIRDFCEEITDGTHESPKEVENGFKLITGKHILNGFIDFETAYSISEEDHLNIRKRSGLNKGDILFSNIGTLGNIALVTQDFEFSCKNVVIFKHKENYNNFLYTYLANENTKNKLSGQSAGVAQKFYSLKFIRNFDDYFPTDELIEEFDGIVKSQYELKYNLHSQNQLLKEARDILLPRLMTGMIDVEQLVLPEPFSNPSASTQEPQAA